MEGDTDNTKPQFDTVPVPCSDLQVDSHVIIDGRPCKIVEKSEDEEKEEHFRIVGVDVFNGKKYEHVYAASEPMFLAEVKHEDYEVVEIAGEDLIVMAVVSGEVREDVKVPQGELGTQLRGYFADGKNAVITLLVCNGEEVIVAVKESSS